MQIVSTRQPSDLPKSQHSRAKSAKIKPSETELDGSTPAYSKSQLAELKFTETRQSETERNYSKTQISPYSAGDLAGFEPPEATKSEDESRIDAATVDPLMSSSFDNKLATNNPQNSLHSDLKVSEQINTVKIFVTGHQTDYLYIHVDSASFMFRIIVIVFYWPYFVGS